MNNSDDRTGPTGPRLAEPPVATRSSEELLRRTALGDQAAFAALYDRFSDQVYGLAVAVLRSRAQAEEVTQEVFVDVWRLAPRYDPLRGGAGGWITTMAHRRAVDQVRSSQAAAGRERRVAMLEPSDRSGYDEVTEQVENRLEYERLRRCLATLTELQRESVTLAYYRGYTYKETAGVLRVPVGTVKTRMRDGLIRLRDCLGVLS